jgi:hypothetical protein
MVQYFDFEISLVDIEPRIWRGIRIRSTATFAELHDAIQLAFAWDDSHLWEFRTLTARPDPIAGLPSDDGWGPAVPDGGLISLDSYFTSNRAGKRCLYVYDFGDDWEHDVTLVARPCEDETFRRRLLGGERAGPPEDCGGPHGYQRIVHFVETGKDLNGDEASDLGEWIGDWQPDDFDKAAVGAKFDV